MTTVAQKVAYVKSQGQSRQHHCHWPGCPRQVPPAKWGCLPHWKLLPKRIRDAIWNAYRPGQEVNATPSREYVEAARQADEWARAYIARNPTPPAHQGSLLP